MLFIRRTWSSAGHNFVIVDEVDSILIDEARTPLIISGKGEESTKLSMKWPISSSPACAARCLPRRTRRKFRTTSTAITTSRRSPHRLAHGQRHRQGRKYFGVENLSDVENTTLVHHINQAMKARGVMKRDIDYVVKDGQVIIVDEFTGRLMYGRRQRGPASGHRGQGGGRSVASENKTLATITFQNFFRLYAKLSGMTGTAMTEEEEFSAI